MKLVRDLEELPGILAFVILVVLLVWLWWILRKLNVKEFLKHFYKGLGGGGGLNTDDRGKGKQYDPTFNPMFASGYDIDTGIGVGNDGPSPDNFDPDGYTEEDLKREFPGAFA
ncbi:MAG: hypothetical protein WB424_16485 [Terracidiphilus sp.]